MILGVRGFICLGSPLTEVRTWRPLIAYDDGPSMLPVRPAWESKGSPSRHLKPQEIEPLLRDYEGS